MLGGSPFLISAHLRDREIGPIDWRRSFQVVVPSMELSVAMVALFFIAKAAVNVPLWEEASRAPSLPSKYHPPAGPEITKTYPPPSAKNTPPTTPATRSRPPATPPPQSQQPFDVTVEWAQFSIGGKGYGTNFWIDYASRDDCELSPIKAVYFIRIKNLQPVPATVIGYNVDVGGTPLVKVLHKIGFIVGVPDGQNLFGARGIMNRLKPGDTINFGQGPGFSMVQIAFDRDDFARSVILQLDLIENLLKTPLPPNVPVRGWAFFQSPSENAFSLAGQGHVTLETDDSRTFSYAFDLRNAHPDLDMLDRTITAKSFADLSGCRHP
jgi:hypothetical protein